MTFQTLTVAGAHSGGPCLACGRIGVYVKKAKDKFDLAAGWYCDRSPEGLKCREAQIAHYAQTHRNSVCKTAPTRTSIDRLNDGSPKAPAGSSDTLDHTATEPTRTSIDRLNDGGPKASDSGSGNTKAEEETQVAGQSACNLTLQEMFDQGFLTKEELGQATALRDAQAQNAGSSDTLDPTATRTSIDRLNDGGPTAPDGGPKAPAEVEDTAKHNAEDQVVCRLCRFKGPQNQFDKPDKAEEGPESSEWQCKNSNECTIRLRKLMKKTRNAKILGYSFFVLSVMMEICATVFHFFLAQNLMLQTVSYILFATGGALFLASMWFCFRRCWLTGCYNFQK